MSYREYMGARQLVNACRPTLNELIQAAMRVARKDADHENLGKLQQGWPDVWAELNARANASRGVLPEDDEMVVQAH